MKGWFLLDLLSSLPFNLLELFMKGDSENSSAQFATLNNTTLLKILRLPRVWKLFRLVKLMKIFKVTMSNPVLNELIEYFKVQDWLWSLCNFMAFIMLFVHLFSCIWMMGSMFNIPDDLNMLDFDTTRSWLLDKGLITKVDNIVIRANNSRIYLACVYWAFTTLTTVGYGDISP